MFRFKNRFVRYASYMLFTLIIGIGLCALFWLYLVYDEYKEKQNEEATLVIAKQIVSAIEKYRVDNQEYPQTLEVLVPKYINEIKEPKWGTSGWVYKIEDKGFYFAVGYGNSEDQYPVHFYSSWEGKSFWGADF